VKLLTYEELYLLWERQQWQTQELDFRRDREDWHDRFSAEERHERMYGLSSFFIGEQKVAEELGPIMRAAPTEEQRIFLCTQIADEARHVRFFERFYREVGVLESDELPQMLTQTSEHLNENFGRLFDEMLKKRTDRLSAEPEDTEALVEAVTIYHMVIEGMLALTGQHFIMDYNEKEGTLPTFVEGFQNVARDEHRHVAFGRRLPARKGERGRALQAGDPAHAGGVAAGGRRGSLAAMGAGGRRLGAVRLLAGRHEEIRCDLPDAPAQGDRPPGGGRRSGFAAE
jgi:ribonucleoside-diphosphate reductase beta chain